MSSANESTIRLLRAIEEMDIGERHIMEICGTHTMSIARSGLRSMLPLNIKLLSGPGCPVCVTPTAAVDAVLELSSQRDIIIASYGDMLRVPGSTRGDSLARRRALGADVRIVYSPVDAVDIAQKESGKQVVFLGVGFETTAPGTAAAVLTAKERGLKNFTLLSLLKTVEPAMRALITDDSFNVDGLICPGHVATIIGEQGFGYLAREYSLPAVIAGFEPENILLAIYYLSKQLKEGRYELNNVYRSAVSEGGNVLAQKMLDSCFERTDSEWRGLGMIKSSALTLRDELSIFDAQRRFGIEYSVSQLTPCRCGEVITGRIAPSVCPMFAKACTPEDPLGPCMVSSEGACAAAYKYGDIV